VCSLPACRVTKLVHPEATHVKDWPELSVRGSHCLMMDFANKQKRALNSSPHFDSTEVERFPPGFGVFSVGFGPFLECSGTLADFNVSRV